jgi:sterol 3beta-glucosyltransferase
VPKLYFFSWRVIPMPLDWDISATVTGYWFLDQPKDWQPPATLAAFLESGPPPTYVGFGSMPSPDPERMTAMVLDAIRQTGQQAIVGTGGGGMTAPSPSNTIFPIEAVPHDWLFPRVAAVVHHGGAGSTAAGLRVGKPSLICPFFGDQPFWGKRIAALGIGPTPIPQKRLSVETLTQALQQVATDEAMRQRAETLGAQLRTEEGVKRAVSVIGRLVQPH